MVYVILIIFFLIILALPVGLVWIELKNEKKLKKEGYFDQPGKD